MSWITFDFNAFIPKRIVISDSVNSFDIEFYLDDRDRLIQTNLKNSPSSNPFYRAFIRILAGSESIIDIPFIMEQENKNNFNIKGIGGITGDIFWEDVEQNVIQIHNFCDKNHQEKWIKINNKKYTGLTETRSIFHELFKHLSIGGPHYPRFDRQARNNYHLIRGQK